MAERAGDSGTATAAERILEEERRFADRIASLFGKAVDAALEAQAPA